MSEMRAHARVVGLNVASCFSTVSRVLSRGVFVFSRVKFLTLKTEGWGTLSMIYMLDARSLPRPATHQ